MVLVGHVLAEAGHYMEVSLGHSALPWTRGVDIFFVISGFIVTLSASRFAEQPVAFLWRRFLRVAPLYYLFTTLMVVVVVAMPHGAKDTGFEPGQIMASYLFWPWERADGRIAPVLSLGWTLNYEMFFYVLFAFALLTRRSLSTLAGLLFAWVILGLFWPKAPVAIGFWTNPLILEFLFGMALARMWQRGMVRPDIGLALLAMGGGLALMVALHGTDLPRFVAAGLPAMLIVAGGTLFCPASSCVTWKGRILGDASFALYLSHRFVLRALTLILIPVLPATLGGALIFAAIAVAAALVVSVFVHRLIELPLLATLDQPRRAVLT